MNILLVTGGGRGIGAATCVLAGARGYAVAVNYRENAAAAEAVVERVTGAGGQARAFQADVSRESEVVRLFAAVDEWGRLAGLVNNAAVIAKQCRLLDLDQARIERMLSINLVGPMLCAREAVRRMSTRLGGLGGAIVNVSSIAARLGSAFEYVDYAASKGGLDTFTRGLAAEVALEGIRVNGVRPGLVHTEIHADGGEPGRATRLGPAVPIGRAGQPEEIAAAILWLLSEEASFTTGAILDVSGGR